MRQPGKIALLSLWLQQKGAPTGLLLAVLLVIILGVLVVPRRVGQPVKGVIVKFALWPSGKGTSLAAVVRLQGRLITVPVSLSDNCRIGGHIHLTTPEFLWGRSYRAALTPCPAETD